jgi:hypothetical protein
VPLSIHVPPAARCLEGSQRGVMAGPSSPTVLIVVQVLSAWRAHRRPEGPSHGVCCRGEALGEKSIDGGGATLVADGIPLGPCRSVLAWGGLGVESERRSGRTPPAVQWRWHTPPLGDGTTYPPPWRRARKSWPWPQWPRPGPIDCEGRVTLLWSGLRWQRNPSLGSFLRPGARVVVVRLGWSPCVHQLACSIVVRPLGKHTVARGGGCFPTAASPATAGLPPLLDQSEGSPVAPWSWLKLEKPSRRASVGKGGWSTLPC